MAKSPPVVEYFNIVIGGVAPADLGTTMAALAKLGHTDVRPELVTEVHAFRQKANHDVKAADFLREWINDHPTFKAKEAVTHFDLHGRTQGAAYTGLRMLVEEGVLRKLGEGNYARKDVKAIAAPKKKAAAKKAPDYTKRYDVSNSDLILQTAKANGGTFAAAEIKKLFRQRRRNPDSVSNAIHTLMAHDQIERTGSGEYRLLKQVNGAAVVETEVNHG